MLPIEGSQLIFDHMKHFLIDLQIIQLKASIRDMIANSFHIADRNSMLLEGSLNIGIPGEVNPISLTFDECGRLKNDPPKPLTPSKRKAYRPVKFTGQSTATCSTASQISGSISRSESCSPSSLIDCPLDLTKGTSIPTSVQQTPVKERIPNGASAHIPKYISISPLPTMLSSSKSTSNSAGPTPKKRRRVGEMSSRKSGEPRKFRCNQCDGIYHSLRSLECHTQIMHGGYKCHLCNMTFTQRSNLQRHALKHVDFKPFECNLCRKSYYRKDHLMRHMQKTHPLYPVEENIEVKLRSSESLDYLRSAAADQSKPITNNERTEKAENRSVDTPSVDLKIPVISEKIILPNPT